MNKEYKKFVVSSLHGLIQWTIDGLIESVNYRFKLQFPDEKIFYFEANQINRLNKEPVDGNYIDIVAIPIVTLMLTVNDESFAYTRDLGKEYEIDIQHTNYNNEWFYEGEECQSYKDFHKMIKEIEEELTL